MAESLEHVGFREGREFFVFLAGLSGAMAVSLVWRGDYGQALLSGLIVVSCIRPFRTRPRTVGPLLTWVAGILGIALFLVIRFGGAALYHWHA